ncbi:MAG: GNAT family N-acetyltransferase [Opitutales bacterium]
MTEAEVIALFPERDDLQWGDVRLRLEMRTPAVPDRDILPACSFGIHRQVDDQRVGHISFRLGPEAGAVAIIGHIGYGIDKAYRGNGYATQACRALRPLLAKHLGEVVITCDPENTASARSIEKLGATYETTVEVNAGEILKRAQGCIRKRRYRWRVR